MNRFHCTRRHRRTASAQTPAKSLLRRLPFWVVAIGACSFPWFISVLVASPDDQDVRDALAREIAARVLEIEEQRRELHREESEGREALESSEEHGRRLDRDLMAARDGELERAELIANLRRRAEDLVERITAIEQAEAAARPAWIAQVAALEDAVAGGVPFEREPRLAALAEVRNRLGSPQLATRVGAMADLLALALDEVRRFASREVTHQPLAVSETTTRHFVTLRIGLVSGIAVSEDDLTVGRCGPGVPWTFSVEPPAAIAIRSAIRQARRLAPPKIEFLPMEPRGRSGETADPSPTPGDRPPR